MLGVTSEDKRWRSVREDFTDFPGEEHPAMTALKTGKPVRDVIMGVYNPDEGYKWLRVDAVPEFRGAEGKPYRVYASLTDITERREIEIIYENQRQLLDTLINAIPLPIFFKDVSGRYMGCNDAFSDFIGLDKDSIIGKTVFDISPGEYAEVYHRADLNIMERKEDTVYEADARHADGTIRHVIFHKAVFHDSDGSMKGLVGIMLDISERKRYEDELRRIKDDLEKSQGAAHIGIWRWYIKEDRVEWSDELYHIFGLEKSSFNGKLSDLLMSSIHPDDRGKVEESNRLVLEENKPNAAEFRIVRNDGSIRVVWSEAGEFETDESGNPSILRGYLQDITERNKTEEKLVQAVKEQEALLRELQHRVKNNLAMINGLIGLESTRSGDSKVTAVLHNLRNRIGSLERLFSSLYYTGNLTEIRLDSYISEIAGSIAKTYISEVQKIKLATDLEPIVVSVKQAASVGLITNELLINALKYAFPHSMEGEITITLKSSGSGYELAVTDNGVGLPEGFKVKNAAGSGIMIIEMLSEHMGGAFTAESGEFTSFRVTVPSEEGTAARD